MPVLRQIWCVSAVYLMFISAGMTSIALYEKTEDTDASSFMTWGGLVTIMGYLLSSILMDTLGRQLTYTVGILTGITSCLLFIFPDVSMQVLGRAFNELSFGTTAILGLVIIGEYTSPKHRNIFLNMTSVSLFIGHLVGKISSSHLQLKTLRNVSLILHIISLGITLTWPDSPYWLALKGRNEECLETFELLWGNEETSREKKDLLSRNSSQTKTLAETVFGLYKTCLKLKFRRSATIVVVGAILVEASGKYYVPMFAENILAGASNERPSDGSTVSLIIVFSSVFSCVLLAKFRNRQVLLATGFASVFVMFLGSIYIFLSMYKIVSPSSWLYVLLVVLYVVLSNLGATSIPTTLMGEVFPLEYKAVGIFVAGVLASTISWSVVKMATYLLGSFHVYGTLAIFGLLMTICLLFLLVILPETKGRTLLEIEDYFRNGWFAEDSEDCYNGEEERMCQSTQKW